MNILVVCHYGLYQNLSASFIHNQAKSYASQGHQVRVVIFVPAGKACDGRRLGPALTIKQADGLKLYYLRFLSLSNFGSGWFNTPSGLAALRLHLPKILAGFRPDIIHAHTLGVDSESGAWLKEKTACPLVVTTHGSDTFVPFTKGEHLWLKQHADKADTVICVSTLLKNRLLECGVTAPISVILNGFNIQYALSDVEKKPLSMVQAGYLVARKKADITIRAFAMLRDRHPEASLEIVGSGSELKRFQLLCKELNVTDAVHFHGFLPNPETLAEISKAQFFVMPSVREGFGIVYLEAMTNGCITIGTEEEGIADLIVNGENGFLVPPDDPAAIVQVVEWCIDHPSEAAAIAERGRRDAQELTWEKNATQYLKLFESLIEEKERNA